MERPRSLRLSANAKLSGKGAISLAEDIAVRALLSGMADSILKCNS